MQHEYTISGESTTHPVATDTSQELQDADHHINVEGQIHIFLVFLHILHFEAAVDNPHQEDVPEKHSQSPQVAQGWHEIDNGT